MIRRATRADLPTIVHLIADDPLGRTREDMSDPLNPAYAAGFDAIARDPNQLLMVIEADGEVAGCMLLSFLPGISRQGAWRCLIESVHVASAHRSRGHGRALMEWALAEARARGCKLAQLTSHKSRTRAHSFYKRLGFEASHEGLKMDLTKT